MFSCPQKKDKLDFSQSRFRANCKGSANDSSLFSLSLSLSSSSTSSPSPSPSSPSPSSSSSSVFLLPVYYVYGNTMPTIRASNASMFEHAASMVKVNCEEIRHTFRAPIRRVDIIECWTEKTKTRGEKKKKERNAIHNQLFMFVNSIVNQEHEYQP